MANELVNMSDQFQGLPMDSLIGGPLAAACEAQLKLANATADFIRVVGFLPPEKPDPNDPNAVGDTRTATFRFKRPVEVPAPPGADLTAGELPVPTIHEEKVEMEVPLLAIVKVPALSITSVDITFDMEVKSSFSTSTKTAAEASMKGGITAGYPPFISAHVSIQGSVSTHKENTRSSDNSAKYHVEVHAEDSGMPEGLARVMDILQTAIAPKNIERQGSKSNPSPAAPTSP